MEQSSSPVMREHVSDTLPPSDDKVLPVTPAKHFFVRLDQTMLMLLAKFKMTPTMCRVLFYLLGRMEYNNQCYVASRASRDISADTGIAEAQVSRALSRLRQVDLVRSKKRTMQHIVNPMLAARGTKYMDSEVQDLWDEMPCSSDESALGFF